MWYFNWMLRKGMLLAVFMNSLGVHAETARLLLDLQDVRDTVGQIRASIYRNSDTFRKEERAVQIISAPAAQGEVRLVAEGLLPGRYAVMVYHDENGDNKLNLRFGMFPTEGYGLSNNPKVMGPPSFEASAFDLQAPETQISIKLTY